MDDKAGGAAPRLISDSNVRHAAGSTTCSSAGRPSSCAWSRRASGLRIDMSASIAVSIDYCRLLAGGYSERRLRRRPTTDLKAGGVTVGRGAG